MRLQQATLMCIGVALAVLAVPAPSSSAPAGPFPPCDYRPSRTIAANQYARVFKELRGDDGVFGCLFRRNRGFELGTQSGEDASFRVEQVRLNGPLVGYANARNTRNATITSILVKDLRTRRDRRRQSFREFEPGDEDFIKRTTDLELKRNGSIAWIFELEGYLTSDHPGRIRYDVQKLDADGFTTLDSGPDVEPSSLALSGSRLYWTRAGQPKSALLR